jgi:hypothetical protein
MDDPSTVKKFQIIGGNEGGFADASLKEFLLRSAREEGKTKQKTLMMTQNFNNLFSTVSDSQSVVSSTSTSKFCKKLKHSVKGQLSEDFTSFTSSLNTEMDTLPLKPSIDRPT